MTRERIRKIARWFELGSLALIAVDLVLYAAWVVPVDRLAASDERRHEELTERLQIEKGVVARFEEFRNAAPETAQELDAFIEKHISPRREAYYRAARLMRELADRSGLQLAGISYKLDPWRGEPLRRLAVEVSVDGPFDGMLKFAHDLETSKDFVVLEECNLQESGDGDLKMRLTTGMYLEP
jgi:Tfp pilus assembly protein PilO